MTDIDLSKVTTIRSAAETVEAKYAKLDDAGILNLVEMAQRGEMKDKMRIGIAVQLAEERGLVTLG